MAIQINSDAFNITWVKWIVLWSFFVFFIIINISKCIGTKLKNTENDFKPKTGENQRNWEQRRAQKYKRIQKVKRGNEEKINVIIFYVYLVLA